MARPKKGHNSGEVTDEYIQDQAKKYVKTMEISTLQNEERAQIRADLKDVGVDPKAFQDALKALQPKKEKEEKEEKEEYMASFAKCAGALDILGQESLFSYFLKKEEVRKQKKAEKKDGKVKHPLVETPGFGKSKAA